jgi:CRISPR/Cas system-associated exonuclease Cas4 (RecB family)
MNYRIIPSELTFLYQSCKRCFVNRVKHGLEQPSIPLPSVFNTVAYLQKEYYAGKRTDLISPRLPPGSIDYGELRVQSGRIELPGCASTCFIVGRFDIVARLDDGSYAVLDFKTGDPNEEKASMYSRQLHAYAYALEHPEQGALELRPVSNLGLVYFIPDHCERTGPERQVIGGQLQWVPVNLDVEEFLQFLTEVVKLLDGPLPKPDPQCEWCAYYAQRKSLERSAAEKSAEAQIEEPPACPLCHGPMRLRSGRYGDFWSCLRYPDCKGTRNATE